MTNDFTEKEMKAFLNCIDWLLTFEANDGLKVFNTGWIEFPTDEYPILRKFWEDRHKRDRKIQKGQKETKDGTE